MEFGEVLRRRRMIRSYDMTRPVPPAAIDAVLAAALRAPSAGFTQGISFLVLSSDAERETFWRLTGDSDTAWLRGMRTAPVLVLVWTSGRPTSIGTPSPTRAGPTEIRRTGPRPTGSSTPAWQAWRRCCRRSTSISAPASSAFRRTGLPSYAKPSASRQVS